ncbi:long-subunit acyl-CoA synthetase (AMP-forming) [Roseibium hamelinense]|uniref:Long-subunit acyl-CoA synthetase (AMP-forming) n=1 Tax=Roseibium hamelinense TaxID=150831 RepID=A0A562SBZ9_9HYPH|nr:AMP-binding protein [Roseibium hamelinense]MTI42168.1 AMP-dependent synthetase [Roseibium hamelinense]TWI78728.1 long-subunit acyl-CoA synthetase (AMP-forming) [Roseibium hamelinense]
MGVSYPIPYEMLKKWASETPDKVYLRQPVNRVVQEKTWSQVHDEVLRLASAFLAMGLQKGDVVAILGKNTAEWFITDFALGAAGLVPAPIYFTAGEETIRYVLEHSEAKAIVLGKLDDTAPAKAAIPDGMITISQPYDTLPCDHQMTELISRHEPLAKVNEPGMDDTFSLLYTSGTTGHPKGIVVTFRNIGYSSTKAVQALGYSSDDRLISYLPLAHITERAMVQHVGLFHGCTVSFVESLETFPDDVRNANPTVFISVPRLWMKFQSGILAKLPQKKLDLYLKIPILNSIVKKKIKKTLGLENARICGSGAAPISPAVLEWFCTLGIDITEGFGMSETSGLVAVQYPFKRAKIGTLGKPSNGSEIKISSDGELMISGDCVVKEYYKDPQQTSETFKDGWLCTGDKGEIDKDGCLRITGRVKELFKTGKGKYVAPVPIESLVLENPYIEQICVMGYGLPQPVAVVVLADDVTETVDNKTLRDSLANTLNKINGQLEAHEKLSHLVVADEPWTIENDLLTPTMKIRRNLLEKRYEELISRPTKGGVVMEREVA